MGLTRVVSLSAGSMVVIMVVAMIGVLGNARTTVQPIDLGISESLLPGNMLPATARCDRRTSSENVMYCDIMDNGRTIYFSYDAKRNVIISTVASLKGRKKIGELILAWGTPTGYKKWGIAAKVYWGKRSAYVVTRDFSPDSVASFVTFTLEPAEVSPWKGFTG